MTKNLEDLAEALYQITVEYTDIHFEVNNKEPLDRQRWAALHIGFTGALKVFGYSESDVMEIVDRTQKMMEERMVNIL